MQGLKYIAIRLLILLAFIGTAQVLHQKYLYPGILKKEAWLKSLVEKRMKKQNDILYFSASTNRAYAADDHHTYSISELIEQQLGRKINVIDTGAIHGGIFLEVLKRIPKEKLPKTLIMDLNIRSFGAHWIHSDLENALQRNFVYWNQRPSLVNHLFAATKWYKYQSPAEHLRAIEYQQKFEKLPFGKQHSTIKKWCDSLFKTTNYTDEAKIMTEHFGFLIDNKNERLQSFDEIVDFATKKKIKLHLTLLPENVEKMAELMDPTLARLVSMNAQFLKNRYQKMGISVIDLHTAVGKDGFFENFPTEHYRDFGRAKVAKGVAEALKK